MGDHLWVGSGFVGVGIQMVGEDTGQQERVCTAHEGEGLALVEVAV